MLKDYIAAFARAARAQGAARLRFYTGQTASRAAAVYNGELERLDRAESCRLFVEGEVEGFAGSVFVEDFQPELIDEQIRALRECALEGRRPFLAPPLIPLPEPEAAEREFLPLDELTAKLLSACEAARAVDSSIQLHDCGLHEERGAVTLADGEGTAMTDLTGGVHFHISLAARRGEAVQMAGRGVSLPWGRLPDMEALARQAAEEALSRLDAASYPTGHSRVVLDSRVVCELLDAFAPAFFAHNVHKHMSVLEGRLDRQVAGENVTLLEAPRHPDGLRCRRFDDEGTPTASKAVLDRGVLRTYLHNRQSAAKDGLASGGNGFRPSLSEEAATGYTNLILAAGERSREELMAEMGEGLLITHVSGVFAGARPTTGEFSLIARGCQVHGGQAGRAVSQITVAGDFFQMLGQVRAVGRDTSWFYAPNGCTGAPSLLVDALAISGS